MMDAEFLGVLFENWLGSFLLVVARMTGFVTQAPILSEQTIAVPAKAGIIFLFALLGNFFTDALSAEQLESLNYLTSLLLNLLIGFLIGFIANLFISITEVAGEILDVQLGLNSSVIMVGGIQSTVFSRTLRNLGLLVFLYLGGMEMTLYSLAESFRTFPLSEVNLGSLDFRLENVIDLTKDVMMLGILTASPILVIIVFQDLVLGLMSRAAQQINPFQLSFSLKPLVGMLVLVFCLPFIYEKMIWLLEHSTPALFWNPPSLGYN